MDYGGSMSTDTPHPNHIGLRTSELLKRLPIGRTTLWRLMKSGKVKSIRFGRLIVIPMDEVARLEREGTSPGEAA